MAESIIGLKVQIGGQEKVLTSMGDIKKVIKQMQFELLAVTEEFGASSEQAIKLASQIENMKDKMADAKSMTDAFNPDAKFKAFSQSLQGVAGGFAVVQGAMGLFGAESEDLQKSLLKVQSALALSEGLNTFLDTGIQGFKNLKSVIISAFTTLKAQITSTGVGALVIGLSVAVYALYQNFEKLTGITKEATDANKAYNDTLDETNQAGTDAIKNVNNVKNAFNDAKQGVISKKDALKIYNDTLGDSLGHTNSLEVAEKNLNNKADAYIKATMLKAQANAMFAMSAKLQAEQLTADQKDNTNIFEKIGAGFALLTGQFSSYSEALKTKNKENTDNIKKDLGEQIETYNKLGTKLADEARKTEKDAQIKIGVKSDKEGESESEKARQKLLKDFAESRKELADKLALGNKSLEEEVQKMADAELKTEADKNAEIQKMDEESARFRMGVLQKVANKKEEDIKKEKELEKARFEEGLQLATQYAQSAGALSDALYSAKLEGVQKGSKEEEKILRQQFETNKKIQIAQTIISGLNGVVNALSAKSVLPEPFGAIARGVNAGFIVATTGATISKIAQQQYKGTSNNLGGVGGSSPAPVSPSTPVQQTITTLNQGSINALGNQAIKAYVVETDIRNSQTRINRILTNSKFK